MGYKSLDFTAKIFSVNLTTFKGWIEQNYMILIWLPIVGKLDGLSVKNFNTSEIH